MTELNDNITELSKEEQKVLFYWQNGDNMTEAYKRVMLSKFDIQTLTEAALRKRVARFFGTYRMREAMAATPGSRGEKARADFEKWKESQRQDAIKSYSKPSPLVEYGKAKSLGLTDDEELKTQDKTDRDKWLESLNVNVNPSAMTIYGTGQFLAYMAVKEIMDRQKEIKRLNISALDKNGSVFTPTIISALKTAAAMVLPFAPAPSAEDRKEMSKAAVLLGLFPDSISESPDDYTAEPPSTASTTED